ncbi:hypothetical protein SanaruYs_36780 [Chryseotalea sanaruensis]|uniref:Toxin-antitoxin system YwqK family antitoxin n=1 Tax=Chryseotalea sanaruensis TaxID=2482724 RepID=A0A401UF08_9BACT|nr:hypothetical protein [Chryseotalea sanaruensis]GCC53434.1 hypothetical protein SanaruYs_36780 [Chryseotalea sanaruensis]
MSRSNALLILIIFFISCTRKKDGVQKELEYYDKGQLKHEFIIDEFGRRDGLGISYYENGKIMAKTDWKKGKLDGKKVFYYDNGRIQQVSEYRIGIPLKVEDYTEDGYLKQLTIYNSIGRVVDYYNYKKDGARDFTLGTKTPIFIPYKDTVDVGEDYILDIRLGNRQFSNVDVIIGDPEDPKIIKKNKALPKKDSLTSILVIKTDSVGEREISGVVFERNQNWDSLDVTPFIHRYYVRSSSRQKSI